MNGAADAETKPIWNSLAGETREKMPGFMGINARPLKCLNHFYILVASPEHFSGREARRTDSTWGFGTASAAPIRGKLFNIIV